MHLGKVANSDVEKAGIFNNFFCSIFTREDASALADLKAQLSYSVNSITSVSISADNVFRIDPTKSSGPDSIPGCLHKEDASFIDESLADLFSRSISEGKLPDDWKTANVVPVHKKGNRRDPQNYRPVSLTSLVSNVLERLVAAQLQAFLDTNNILSTSQHGFRAKHTYLTQLLESIHRLAQSLDHSITDRQHSHPDSCFLIWPKLLTVCLMVVYF